jgi:hypothetical protein
VGRFCKKKSMKPEPESKNEDGPEAVSSMKMCAPNVKNSMLQQIRIVTGSNVWTAASGSMGCALCMVIGAILVVSNLLKNKKNK